MLRIFLWAGYIQNRFGIFYFFQPSATLPDTEKWFIISTFLNQTNIGSVNVLNFSRMLAKFIINNYFDYTIYNDSMHTKTNYTRLNVCYTIILVKIKGIIKLHEW